jgi:hypothetical protein
MGSTPNYSTGVFSVAGGANVTVSGELEVYDIAVYGSNTAGIVISVDAEVTNVADWSGAGKHAITGSRSSETVAMVATANQLTNALIGDTFPRFLKDGTVVSQTGGDGIVLSGLLYS